MKKLIDAETRFKNSEPTKLERVGRELGRDGFTNNTNAIEQLTKNHLPQWRTKRRGTTCLCGGGNLDFLGFYPPVTRKRRRCSA